MANPFATVVLGVLLLCLLLGITAAPQGGGKLQQIIAAAEKAPANVIHLDDETYAHFAIRPVGYSLIVFLTASHPKFKCSICKNIDEEYKLLASAYRAQNKKEGTQPRLFFLRLDYESSSQVFQKYEVQSVPVIFHIGDSSSGSGSSSSSGKGGDSKNYQILIRDRLAIQNEVHAEGMISFVKDRTGISLTIVRSQIWVYLWLLLILGAVVSCIRPVINSLDTILLPMIRSKPLWLVVSLGVYTCAISGLIFDIIRLPQLYYHNQQTGQIMWFYPQSGSQFVVEGFIIGFLNLGCALSLVFLTVKAPLFKSEQGRMLAVGFSVLFFALFFNQVKSFYIMKNRWYNSAH